MVKYLNLSQLIEIEEKLNEGKIFWQIAKELGRFHSTILWQIMYIQKQKMEFALIYYINVHGRI